MNIVFIAYHLLDDGLVGSLRPRSLARLLEERDNRLIYYTRDSWGWVATSKFMWSLVCFWRLLWADADKAYVSCGPFWHLLAIWLACKLTNKKVIYDFRDPWSANIRYGYGNQIAKANPIKLKLAEFLEKLIYKDCGRFWVCTSGMFELYTELFSDNEKIDLVFNGYDFDDEDIVPVAKRNNNPETLHLACLGKFASYSPERAKVVFEELKERTLQCGPNSLRLEFFGPDLETRELVQEVSLEENTVFHPKMPYLEAVRLAAQADMGLLLINNEKFDLGTKAFDYIGLGLLIYDTFEVNSNARRFYEPFISKDRQKVVDPTIRAAYHRNNRFKDFLKEIDGKEV